jgi:hypothetical protein
MRIWQALAEANPIIYARQSGAASLGIGELVASFNGYKSTPADSSAAPNENVSNAPAEWNTLEELRQMVTSKGCTKAQFDHAKESVGSDPHRVATYLQRFAFIQAARGKIKSK